MSARKLWATSFPRIPGEKYRHESKAAVYRYVRDQRANWLRGALRSQHLVVWLDERDGQGWQRYENVDLDTWGAS